MRAKEIVDNGTFWKMMFDKTDFASYIKNKYTVASRSMMSDDDQEVSIDTDEDDLED